MKVKNKSSVMWSIMGLLLGMIAYDSWACMDTENRDTISKMVTRASEKYLIIPLIFGLMMGHFFWSQHDLKDPEKR